jgi:hypothetical protein
MKSLLASVIFGAVCFGAIFACKPSEPVPTATAKTAMVEEDSPIQAGSIGSEQNEVRKALPDLNFESRTRDSRG